MKNVLTIVAALIIPSFPTLLLSQCGVPTPTPATPAEGTIILPPGHDPARAYPVIVMFPASNGTAASLSGSYPPPTDAIVVLSAGTGSPDDYRTGDNWTRTIARYQSQLDADLATLAARHRIDATKVVLAGFSMGGDLAWALALRNPARVRGAVIMSSRASYRARPTEMRTLAANGGRFFFTMGGAEDPTRRAGGQAAARMLDSLQIANRFEDIPGAGHARAPADVWQRALAFVLAPGEHEGH